MNMLQHFIFGPGFAIGSVRAQSIAARVLRGFVAMDALYEAVNSIDPGSPSSRGPPTHA